MFSERLRNLWNSQNSSRPIGDGLVPRDWFEFKNKADAPAELYIYDVIFPADGFGGGGIGAAQFQEELNMVKANQINLYLNSPGGLVHEGVAIYNALKQHPAKVNVRVMGMAASIASVIAMAGDTVDMGLGSLMMMHNAQIGIAAAGMGDADYLRALQSEVNANFDSSIRVGEMMNSSIAGIYSERTGTPVAEWLALMKGEKWFNEHESVVAGLADTVAGKAVAKPTNTVETSEASPDWRIAARRLVAAAQMEVIHGYGH